MTSAWSDFTANKLFNALLGCKFCKRPPPLSVKRAPHIRACRLFRVCISDNVVPSLIDGQHYLVPLIDELLCLQPGRGRATPGTCVGADCEQSGAPPGGAPPASCGGSSSEAGPSDAAGTPTSPHRQGNLYYFLCPKIGCPKVGLTAQYVSSVHGIDLGWYSKTRRVRSRIVMGLCEQGVSANDILLWCLRCSALDNLVE